MIKSFIVFLFSFSLLFSAQNNLIDTDGDLIPNVEDKCPNTPDGVFINRKGCTQKLVKTINFEHASSIVPFDNKDKVLDMLEIAKEGFGYKILIEGHTDSTADAYTNIVLSKKRVYTIYNRIINSGIDKKRIEMKWYGETMPIATNIAEDGRKLNRRVTITFK